MKKQDYLSNKIDPLIPASQSLPELTFKVIILSIILAIVLAAANAYLALKIGTTISASIPASVLAIGILRLFKKSNVLESNIIQTAASAGEGVASALAYTLPAMIILHAWSHFPFWEVSILSLLGGTLGVFFSVPLRRVLLNLPTLRFPEGTAIGNVLKATAEGSDQLRLMARGGMIGGLIALAQSGLEVLGSQMDIWTRVGPTVLGASLGFSPAPLAAGYIVGFEAGSSVLLGFIGGWLIILPFLIYQMPHVPTQGLYTFVMSVWSAKLRYVGVGVMLVGGVWTLVRLMKPVIDGLRISFGSVSKINKGKRYKVLRTELDIPLKVVVFGSLLTLVLLYWAIFHYSSVMGVHLAGHRILIVAGVTMIYFLTIGFMLATICGYFTGLIGSTNNPLSGILILALLVIGLIFSFVIPAGSAVQEARIAGLMILITTVTATIASISNENLQDLKAGQMVGATPWKQQFILLIGVIASSFVAAPVLEMLYKAYGIGGVFPRPGMNPAHMLAAPQAGLMAAIASGLRSHNLPWDMIAIGGGFAVVAIILDEVFRRTINWRVAVLAVGLGVYLPPQIMTPLIAGSLINLFVRLRIHGKKTEAAKEKARDKQNDAVLLACGLVAGAALMGVLLAIPFMILGNTEALSIVPTSFHSIAVVLGLLSTIAIIIWIWRTATQQKG